MLSARKTRATVVHQQDSIRQIAQMIGQQAQQIAALGELVGGRSFFGRLRWLLFGK